jgi:hypothetical protein
VNVHHLLAFLWLHWRLRVNQIKRGGLANQILLVLVAIHLALAVVALFVGSFFLAFALTEVPPIVHLLIWDGVVIAFLAWWSIGLLTDLQRAEALSLTKFLHLPVSLSGVFTLNYLSSLFSLNLMLSAPTMIGFSLGLAFAVGPMHLLLVPLVASFLLMVSGLSYQFQGWLASLMVNKRRRRTVIFIVTMVFILAFQLPNLINFLRPWDAEKGEVPRALRTKEDRQETWRKVEETAWYANAAAPAGWLPLGAMELMAGNPLPALAGTLGMGLIGTASLWRAYRTTLRLYTGQFTAGAKVPAPVAPPEPTREPSAAPQAGGLLTMRIPGLSEPAAAITLASFRSLTRAPEARMLLLTPVFMLVIFGAMFWRGTIDMPENLRLLLGCGAIAMILMTMIQLVGNQFGFDRSGFRVYVLSPAPRADILLGKNLGIAPLVLMLAVPLLVVLQVAHPMRFDHFLALAPQLVSMFLLFCLLANFLSIFAPVPIAPGTLRPAKSELAPVLWQMLFMFVYTNAQVLTLLPLGVELLLDLLELRFGMPVCLILTVAQCAAIVWLYRLTMGWQGRLLQNREQRILEVVTTKAE